MQISSKVQEKNSNFAKELQKKKEIWQGIGVKPGDHRKNTTELEKKGI